MGQGKGIIYKLLYAFAMILVLYNLLYFVNTTITRNEYLNVFGISIMAKKDILITRSIKNMSEIHEDDYIAYKWNGSIKTGSIVNQYQNFETLETNYTIRPEKSIIPDYGKLTVKQVIGKRIKLIKNMGFLVRFLQSKFMTFLSILFLIGNVYYNHYMYKMKVRRNLKKSIKEDGLK